MGKKGLKVYKSGAKINNENDIFYPSMFKTEKEFIDYRCKMWFYIRKVNMNISNLNGLSPEELLRLTGQDKSVPVNLQKILECFKISVLPMDFSELEKTYMENEHILGALVSTDDKAAIFYSKDNEENSHRYRFTIAHELGHCCLHNKRKSVFLRSDSESLDEDEKAANTFAGALLIPKDSLINSIKSLIFPSLQVLSNIFEVSEAVMKARLDLLNIQDKIMGYNI